MSHGGAGQLGSAATRSQYNLLPTFPEGTSDGAAYLEAPSVIYPTSPIYNFTL